MHTLHRVYESLAAQTYRNFEWLIIDDGSTDNTYELVENWKKEANFPIRYYWQENKGKHVAFNKGVKEARGEFFLPLDSDDACVPEALERFKYYWDSIQPNQKQLFSGICALCRDQNGKLVGDRFPFDIMDSNSLEIHYRYKVKGEKWGFQRRDVLLRYPYPEAKGVKFIPEGIVWNRIAKLYKIRFVNEMLRIYWVQRTSDSDQLTRALYFPKKHAPGCAFYYESCLNEHIVWYRYAPLEFLRYAIHYIRLSLHTKLTIFEIFKNIKPKISKVLVFLAIPIGALLYQFEKKDMNIISLFKSILKLMHYRKRKY